MSFVYRKHEPGLYTVGFYAPDGDWVTESRHTLRPDTVARVRWLNGACGPEPGSTDIGDACRCGGSAVTS